MNRMYDNERKHPGICMRGLELCQETPEMIERRSKNRERRLAFRLNKQSAKQYKE